LPDNSPNIAALGFYLSVGLLGSALLALGLLMMKSRAHRLPIAEGAGIFRAIATWLKDPVWTGGLFVQTAGYALFVISLAEAPISMVSVMMQGGIALFVLFAAVFLGERARPIEWAGIAITILAMVLLGISLTGGAEQAPADSGAMVAASLALIAAGYLSLKARRFRNNGVGAAIFSGVIFGLATIYTKAMADDYTARTSIAPLLRVVTNPYVYGTIVTNIVGMVALQNSFAAARGIIAMPLASALSNIVPIASGPVVFGERLPSDPTHASMRIAAFVLTVLGSTLIANSRDEARERRG
jgi:drug/metabolite transporter (DMT)-like permease